MHTCIGGHLSTTITTWKILDACYQWSIFHNNNITFTNCVIVVNDLVILQGC
jgi:hypothetical protein